MCGLVESGFRAKPATPTLAFEPLKLAGRFHANHTLLLWSSSRQAISNPPPMDSPSGNAVRKILRLFGVACQ
jgi:hypothetical protein